MKFKDAVSSDDNMTTSLIDRFWSVRLGHFLFLNPMLHSSVEKQSSKQKTQANVDRQ